jgi:hypothetical protein
MMLSKRNLLCLGFAVLLFYIAGRLEYSQFYGFTLSVIRDFSGGRLHFVGKFPFWLFGDPIFGIVMASIPVSFGLCLSIANKKRLHSTTWTFLYYLPTFLVVFLATCYYESFFLLASFDRYSGDVIRYPVRDVNLNAIFVTPLVLTTLFVVFIGLISRNKLVTKRRHPL